MDIHLTPEEERLVQHAQEAVVRFNRMRHSRGGIDTLYSFLLSDSGKIYDGAAFESNLPHASICGERVAIANLVLQEGYPAKIKTILVADPVPRVQEHSTPPCGTCRHVIWHHGAPETTVLLMQYIQGKEGWTFPKIEKLTMRELYPHPYEPKEGLWDPE